MDIQFLGATQTVTGSKYLLKTDTKQFFVDCGLFQGLKSLRLENWNKLPINPSEIDYVFLTHAHIDHSGYLPLLVKQGFRGKIYCTAPTFELCKILLIDSGYLQEEDAKRANKYSYTKHRPALPLYNKQDAKECLKYFEVINFAEIVDFGDNLKVSFHYASHILGAASVRIECDGVSVLFSGDMGRADDPIMLPPKPPVQSDYLVVESTYGNRLHGSDLPVDQLEEVINRTVERKGTIVIPAFAVGRAQAILYYIHQLKTEDRIEDIPVYIDSPMAINATELFCEYSDQHRLTPDESAKVCDEAVYVRSVDESKSVSQQDQPKIIISASGMASGGRVLHHLARFAPDPNSSIVFTGYQAEGTRGDRIVSGEKSVKMLGQMVPINAEIVQLTNASAHADYEGLLGWMSQMNIPPKKVFLVHGETESAEVLKVRIEERLHWNCMIPNYKYQETLT